MRKLKRTHKNLMIIEAGYIYCNRHNLNFDTFIDDVFMTEQFNCGEGSEFDNICIDLRFYRYMSNYVPKTITDVEYDLCIEKFGES